MAGVVGGVAPAAVAQHAPGNFSVDCLPRQISGGGSLDQHLPEHQPDLNALRGQAIETPHLLGRLNEAALTPARALALLTEEIRLLMHE